ncbi:MAG: hypothetical protein H6R18_720 [Proteobacteria bacterium]|nr:hypothetical protein [Pseudomonadota bacterium]
MSRAAKIVFAVFVAGFLLLIGLVAVGWWWWSKHGDELLESGKQTIAEGRKEGAKLKEPQCLDMALQKYHRDRDDIVAAIKNHLWLKSCLETSQVQEDFCRNIPGADQALESAFWAIAKCDDLQASDDYCRKIFQEVQKYCISPQRAKKRRDE